MQFNYFANIFHLKIPNLKHYFAVEIILKMQNFIMHAVKLTYYIVHVVTQIQLFAALMTLTPLPSEICPV